MYGLLWLIVARAVRHESTPEALVAWIGELPAEDRFRLCALADLTRSEFAAVRGPYRALFGVLRRAAYVDDGEQVAA